MRCGAFWNTITREMCGNWKTLLCSLFLWQIGEHILSEKLLQMPMQVHAIGEDVEKWDRKGPLNEYLANLEKEIIREVMISEGGNISKTAEVLHIKRQTLRRQIKEIWNKWMIVLPIGRQYMQKYLHIKRKIICIPHNFIEKVEINTKYIFCEKQDFYAEIAYKPCFLCKAMFWGILYTSKLLA